MPSTPPEPRSKRSTSSKRARYVIRQHPHPAGFELVVEGATRRILFIARPKPTEPARYEILEAEADKRRAFVVKTVRMGQVTRHVLLDGESERLSLLLSPPSLDVSVRDGQRHVIARFRPLGPGLVVLQTRSTVHARLRFTQYAAPVWLRVHCDMEEGAEWLFAVLLYAILATEQMTQKGPVLESSKTLPPQQLISQP